MQLPLALVSSPEPEDTEEAEQQRCADDRSQNRGIAAYPQHERRQEIDDGHYADQNSGGGDRLRFCFRCHATSSAADPAAISARMSSRRRFCVPSGPKFSGESQASNAALTTGHSPSMIENHAVSRLAPREMTCWRNTPSKVKPYRSAVTLLGSFSLWHFHS